MGRLPPKRHALGERLGHVLHRELVVLVHVRLPDQILQLALCLHVHWVSLKPPPLWGHRRGVSRRRRRHHPHPAAAAAPSSPRAASTPAPARSGPAGRASSLCARSAGQDAGERRSLHAAGGTTPRTSRSLERKASASFGLENWSCGKAEGPRLARRGCEPGARETAPPAPARRAHQQASPGLRRRPAAGPPGAACPDTQAAGTPATRSARFGQPVARRRTWTSFQVRPR